MGCHFLLQGIFPTLGLNPHLLNWQVDSLLLSHLQSLELRTNVSCIKMALVHLHRRGPAASEGLNWGEKGFLPTGRSWILDSHQPGMHRSRKVGKDPRHSCGHPSEGKPSKNEAHRPALSSWVAQSTELLTFVKSSSKILKPSTLSLSQRSKLLLKDWNGWERFQKNKVLKGSYKFHKLSLQIGYLLWIFLKIKFQLWQDPKMSEILS